MTTHYEKIQALGNRMASNLETMGVSASFNDGGLTLADKILQIQHFNDGLLLYADKNIIQTGDTVNLYALLLEDGIPQSNAEIEFFVKGNSPTLRTLTADTDNDVSPKYSFASMPTFSDSSERVYLDADHSIYLLKYGSNQVQLCIGRSSTVCTPGITSISLDNNILTFTGNGGTVNADVSDKDMSVIYSDVSGVTINDYYSVYTAVTNSCGVATVSYTGKGAGLLNIKAFASNRIIQSETFVVEDCLKYDTEVLTSKNYNIGLNDMNFYLEFIVHPTASSDSTAYINITDGNNRYLQIGDLYGATNVNCGVNWTGGTFYGKAISVDTDTKVTLRRTGTNMVLTVGESTYNISNMNITCNTLLNAVISNNQIKQFKIYQI